MDDLAADVSPDVWLNGSPNITRLFALPRWQQREPEPFKLNVESAGGKQTTYVLMRKNVVLRGGRTHPIYYFVKEGTPGQPDPNYFEYHINENFRQDLPDSNFEVVGRAMMEYFDMSAEVAAEVNGRFAAEIRGYTKEQRSEMINTLRRKLSNPPL